MMKSSMIVVMMIIVIKCGRLMHVNGHEYIDCDDDDENYDNDGCC